LTYYKELLNRDIYVRVEAPAHVAIFVYDNDTFIVESFLDEPVDVNIVVTKQVGGLLDLQSNEKLSPGSDRQSGRRMMGQQGQSSPRIVFNTQIKPHSYRVFQCQ
jgi:hypothetical protein